MFENSRNFPDQAERMILFIMANTAFQRMFWIIIIFLNSFFPTYFDGMIMFTYLLKHVYVVHKEQLDGNSPYF